MEEELKRIESQLREVEWRWQVTLIISQIPSGYLATYGCIACIANRKHGLNIIARNVAWLRGYLYALLTHDTQLPLHRIAKVNDVDSTADSKETRCYNNRLRGQEGSLRNPRWYCSNTGDQKCR